MSIPRNAEHIEAIQAETNARRQEAKTKMTPTEVARLEVIEECSAKLEAAGVPFQLWAASDDPREDTGSRRGWWVFHKLSYVPQENIDLYSDRVFEAYNSLLPQLLNHQTTYGTITIITYSSKTGRPMSVHSQGQCQFLPPPPDLPTCDCPPSSQE